jgi:ribosomal-protein-alanine N-acetyltransferase
MSIITQTKHLMSRTTVEGEDVVEVSYALVKAFWGQGLALEIGHYAIDYAFNHLKLAELVCFTLPSNKQSLSVMEKLGFHYEKDFMYKGLLHKLYRMRNSNKS